VSDVPLRQIAPGVSIPQLGLGVFKTPPAQAAAAVGTAIETGYRLIDTAAMYQNEAGVGEAVRASGVPRHELFITTKLWNDAQGRDSARRAFEQSRKRLGFDYIDLFLIHWPAPARGLFVQTWEVLIELLAQGAVRAIGVSNFRIEDLERVIAETGVVPSVNQIELHPRLTQPQLSAFHREHGIATEAWSPLARGDVLEQPAIAAIAARHGRSTAQVVLRWHLQLGNIVIPKSVTPSRIAENFDVFGFVLSDAEMGSIGGLDEGSAGRIGPDPAHFGG
jgi:2,5-diketo-D-gluconate reductase A